MSVDPVDFLVEARQHAARVDEMGLRTVVSRAYYAAYHLACGVRHHCPDPPQLPNGKGEGDHQRLIRQFSSVPKKGFKGAGLAKQIGALLSQGRNLRVKADYRLNETVSQNDARNMTDAAGKVENLVKQFVEENAHFSGI